MTNKRISIFTQFMTVSIATAILIFTVLGYTLYHFWTIADQTNFKEIISDIQDTLVYDDTNVMSIAAIQTTDDEWDEIYNYVDELQVK